VGAAARAAGGHPRLVRRPSGPGGGLAAAARDRRAAQGHGQHRDPGWSSGLWLALDRLQDPGNLGTILRTSLASGVGGLWLGGGADPWQPKVLRASAGASLQLPLRRQEELASVVQAAVAVGWQVLAAVREGGEPYWAVDWRPASLLLLGNEGAGLAPELLALPEVRRVSIPHDERVESLNVAVAGGVLLLERWRQVTADRGESSGAGLGR
jgi:TrmH family RNA methyltransferase